MEKKRNKGKVYRLLKGFLLITTLLLGFLIYAKKDADASFINNIFHTNISFTNMNDKIDFYISNILSNFNIFKTNNNEDKLVSGNVSYIKGNINNYYYCESNYIYALSNGLVCKVENNDETYNVTIFYENEVTACYYELKSVSVNYQDKVNTSSIIGEYDNYFKVLFEHNNKLISYEEALLL